MVGSTVANEVALKKVLVGTETVVGTAVTPDYRWLGELAITKDVPRIDKPQATGGYHRRVTPRLGVASFAGTYGEDLTFESLAEHLQYWIKEGATGTTDGETIPGYTYTKSPSFAVDDIASATVQYGVDGLMYLSTGVRHNEGTITIDPDDADGVWKFASTLHVRSKAMLTPIFDGTATGGSTTTVVQTGAAWTINAYTGAFVNVGFGTSVGQVRQITSNTADTLTVSPAFDAAVVAGDTFRIEAEATAGISVPDYEFIPSYGTQVYIDPLDGTIGSTEVLDRIISTNVTVSTTRTSKRFINNAANETSSRSGRGEQTVSGQIRVEFDRFDEYYQWEQLQGFQLRIYQEGTVIDPAGAPATVKYAQIDVPVAYWDTPTEDARENNMTMTLPWTAYLPDSDPIITFTVKNTLATLP